MISMHLPEKKTEDCIERRLSHVEFAWFDLNSRSYKLNNVLKSMRCAVDAYANALDIVSPIETKNDLKINERYLT